MKIYQSKAGKMMLKIKLQCSLSINYFYVYVCVQYEYVTWHSQQQLSNTLTAHKVSVRKTKIDHSNEENLQKALSDEDVWWLMEEFHCGVEGEVRVFTQQDHFID